MALCKLRFSSTVSLWLFVHVLDDVFVLLNFAVIMIIVPWNHGMTSTQQDIKNKQQDINNNKKRDTLSLIRLNMWIVNNNRNSFLLILSL